VLINISLLPSVSSEPTITFWHLSQPAVMVNLIRAPRLRGAGEGGVCKVGHSDIDRPASFPFTETSSGAEISALSTSNVSSAIIGALSSGKSKAA